MDTPFIPGYDLLEPLGEGGMAMTWLARPLGTEDLRVIKVMRPDRLEDRTMKSRFLREVAVTTRLSHPRIARTFDAGETEAGPFLAMEYVAGCELGTFVARWCDGIIPVDLAVGIVLQALDALGYVHGVSGIVHRDLTPSNLMIDFDGSVKLIDFGVVRASVGSFQTAPGTIAGTLQYMSPEQAQGRPVDGRSDLYTIASVLYEVLTGRQLARGNGVSAILYSVVVDQPNTPSFVNPLIPRPLDAVLLRALQKCPEDRYPSAEAFASALRAAFPTSAGPERLSKAVRALFPQDYDVACERRSAIDLAETIEMTALFS